MQLPSSVRLLGLDLGVTSEHAAVVLDAAGGVVPDAAPGPPSTA